MPIYSADQYKKALNGLTTNPSPNPSPAPTSTPISAPIQNKATSTSLYSPDQYKKNLGSLTNPAPLYPSISQNNDILSKVKSATSDVFNWFGKITTPKTETLFSSKENSLTKQGSKYTYTLKGVKDPVTIDTAGPINLQNVSNVFDVLFKLPDKAIDVTQKGLQKFGEVHPVFTEKYLTSAGNSLDKNLKPVLDNLSENAPELRGAFKGMNEVYLGSSKKVMDTFNTEFDHPTTLLKQARYTGGELAGNVLAYIAGGFLLKGLKLGRAAIPLLYTAIDQTSSPSDTTVKQRLLKAPISAIAGWLLPVTESPTLKALLSQAGETGAIMTSQSFINSMII